MSLGLGDLKKKHRSKSIDAVETTSRSENLTSDLSKMSSNKVHQTFERSSSIPNVMTSATTAAPVKSQTPLASSPRSRSHTTRPWTSTGLSRGPSAQRRPSADAVMNEDWLTIYTEAFFSFESVRLKFSVGELLSKLQIIEETVTREAELRFRTLRSFALG